MMVKDYEKLNKKRNQWTQVVLLNKKKKTVFFIAEGCLILL